MAVNCELTTKNAIKMSSDQLIVLVWLVWLVWLVPEKAASKRDRLEALSSCDAFLVCRDLLVETLLQKGSPSRRFFKMISNYNFSVHTLSTLSTLSTLRTPSALPGRSQSFSPTFSVCNFLGKAFLEPTQSAPRSPPTRPAVGFWPPFLSKIIE